MQQAHEWPMKTHQLSTHIPTPNVRSENTKSATRVWKPHSCGTLGCHTSVVSTLVWHFSVFSNLADWFGTCVGTCRLCWMCRPNCHAFMSVCGAGDRYWINAMATQNQRGGAFETCLNQARWTYGIHQRPWKHVRGHAQIHTCRTSGTN